MTSCAASTLSDGFCIYINTLFQGPVPVVNGSDYRYIVYSTADAAQRDIVSHAITRLEEFLSGEREFEDAIVVEEYAVKETVCGNGLVTDGMGNTFRAIMD